MRKKNTFVNGPIVTADYHPHSETARRKTETHQSNDYYQPQTTSWSQSFNTNDDTKHVRPYFLIKPQSVLVLPNEIGN